MPEFPGAGPPVPVQEAQGMNMQARTKGKMVHVTKLPKEEQERLQPLKLPKE